MPERPHNQTLRSAHFRVARPTDRLKEVEAFYTKGLGFKVIGQFQDHDGFDGVMLGHDGAPYHLEFTSKHGHPSGKSPSQEHLLVFYLPDATEWQAVVERVESLGMSPVKSFNPYWDRNGRTYEDPDGYRIVLQNADWPTETAHVSPS